jgi:transcriptional regulator with XRE-family HTH domain
MIRWLRVCAGWTQEQLAAAAKCNDVTIWRWETGRPINTNRRKREIARLVHRLESLGLAELVRTELETLRRPAK